MVQTVPGIYARGVRLVERARYPELEPAFRTIGVNLGAIYRLKERPITTKLV